MNNTWFKSFLIFFLFWSVSARAQVVWPGDINNNGVVNGVDVLYLGLAYGSMGPVREGGSEEWLPQSVTAFWGSTFIDGTDYAYADCNGDGTVNEDDLDDVIKQNFGLTHDVLSADGFANGTTGMDPTLQLEPEVNMAPLGAMVNIDLRMGTPAFPISNFYGIALKMSYSAEILDENAAEEGFDFDLQENTWLEGGNNETVEYLFHKDHTTGQAELAITRLNQQMIEQGEGVIGQFSIVVEDIIIGSETDTFTIQIDSIFFIDDQFNKYAIVPDSAQVVIGDQASSTTDVNDEVAPLRVTAYPNPAEDFFVVQAEHNIEQLRIYNAVGHPMPLTAQPGFSSRVLIHTNDWPPGLYYLEVHAAGQAIIRKLAIVSDKP